MKRFNTMYNIGKVKYVINIHNGIDKHKDGSDFLELIHSIIKRNLKQE